MFSEDRFDAHLDNSMRALTCACKMTLENFCGMDEDSRSIIYDLRKGLIESFSSISHGLKEGGIVSRHT